jgi:hypothetical protein
MTGQLCDTVRDKLGVVEKPSNDGHWWVLVDGVRALIHESELRENP